MCMTDLIFLCQRCRTIARGGAIDEKLVGALRMATWHVVCERCQAEADIPLTETMLHDPKVAQALRLI